MIMIDDRWQMMSAAISCNERMFRYLASLCIVSLEESHCEVKSMPEKLVPTIGISNRPFAHGSCITCGQQAEQPWVPSRFD